MPERVTAKWIASLGNEELIAAESQLHASFAARERAEKERAGARYSMMNGPRALVSAWHEWVMLNNATRSRGIVISRRA